MKKIYLISILSIFTMSLFCQGTWTKLPVSEQGVPKPVMVPGSAGQWDEEFIAPVSVIYYKNTYHMWYWGGIYTDTSRVGHATSPDGVEWTKDTNNPVLDVGPNGDWDDNTIMPGSVLVIDSVFHTWYTGHTGPIFNENFRIGHATSQDGITWIKDPNNPVMSMGPNGTWDDTWVAGAIVIHDGSEYHMWYTGWDGVGYTRIGHATSPDAMTWTKDENNPVLTSELGSWEYPSVNGGAAVYDGLTYHMWYSGGFAAEMKIGHAVSEDGRTWIRDANNPVLEPGPNNWDWDNKSVDFPAVLFDCTNGKEKLKMWYLGYQDNSGKTCIGYADMPMPDPIIKPVVWLYKDTTTHGENFYVQCNKEGCIYIVPPDTEKDSSAICTACNGNSVEVSAGVPGSLKITHPEHGPYFAYAIDKYGNISEPILVNLIIDVLNIPIASQISIYPNPFSDFTIIGLPENIRVRKIELVDITGRTIRTLDKISGASVTLERDDLPGGIYLIRIQADEIYVKKLIIK